MRRLLVVEDNALLRDMLCTVLSRRFDVISAAGGAEALEKAACHELDAVLTDYEMPAMDGVQVCRELHKQSALSGRAIPVWIMDRSNGSNLAFHAFSAGAVSVLEHPVRIVDLCKRFERQLNSHEKAEERRANERAINSRKRATYLARRTATPVS